MSDVKLRDCPFCGSVNVDPHGWAGKYKGAHDGAIIHGPACDDCGASAGLLGNTTEENIALWNARSESPVEKAAGEMYKALEARQEADATWKNDRTAHNVCHEMTKKADDLARTALAAFDKAKEGR